MNHDKPYEWPALWPTTWQTAWTTQLLTPWQCAVMSGKFSTHFLSAIDISNFFPIEEQSANIASVPTLCKNGLITGAEVSICRWREVRGYRQSANWPVSVKPSSPLRPFLLTRLRPLCQCCTHSTNECSVSKVFPWQLHEFFWGSIPILPTYNGLISQVVSKLSILPQHLDELKVFKVWPCLVLHRCCRGGVTKQMAHFCFQRKIKFDDKSGRSFGHLSK